MKHIALSCLLTALPIFAQPSEGYIYEERPAVGLIYEMSSIENPDYDFKVMGMPFDMSMDYSPLMGVGANMPFNNYIGLNGIVGFQKMTFDYAVRDSAFAREYLDTAFTNLEATDFRGSFDSYNLVVQAGLELGLPLYSDYNSQTMLKLVTYGSGIGGKNFLNGNVKFQNSTLWGYAYGGGVRLAIGSVAFTAGVRSSHVYWRLFFDPVEQTGSDRADDTFMLDYDANFNPFIKATLALY